MARKLLRTFASKDSNVLDIFSGSGTTLLECKYLGIERAFGIELNPFANFMARVKLSDVNSKAAWAALNNVRTWFFDDGFRYDTVSFKNIDFWYTAEVKMLLSKLLCAIKCIEDERVRDFMLLVFCDAARKVSYVNYGGFKMCRSRKKVAGEFHPDVWVEAERIAARNLKLLKDSNEVLLFSGEGAQTVIQGDSRVVQNEIGQGSIDMILTSPPYGDSRTTVAYGQYSRLPWQWLTASNDILSLDSSLLGGRRGSKANNTQCLSPTLERQIERIAEAGDDGRTQDVLSFYADLLDAMRTAAGYLKHGGWFILVTGNRTVKKVCLRTDRIISEFGAGLGLEECDVFSRNIINKRMASRNSPTNESGKTESTMLTENIIILRKA